MKEQLRTQNVLSRLTSHRRDGCHQLEDAVDEGEGEHHLQFIWAEGQLDDGAAQLGVLETSLQGDGPTPAKQCHKQFSDRLYRTILYRTVLYCCCYID